MISLKKNRLYHYIIIKYYNKYKMFLVVVFVIYKKKKDICIFYIYLILNDTHTKDNLIKLFSSLSINQLIIIIMIIKVCISGDVLVLLLN